MLIIDGTDRTVKQYCDIFHWPIAELARRAGISWSSAKSAYIGKSISPRIRRAIATALKEADSTIHIRNIIWEVKLEPITPEEWQNITRNRVAKAFDIPREEVEVTEDKIFVGGEHLGYMDELAGWEGDQSYTIEAFKRQHPGLVESLRNKDTTMNH